jgi:hypothetical protein
LTAVWYVGIIGTKRKLGIAMMPSVGVKTHCVKTQRENTPDVVDYRTYNDYFKNLVTFIEVFSKYAWIVPMKSPKGNSIVESL